MSNTALAYMTEQSVMVRALNIPLSCQSHPPRAESVRKRSPEMMDIRQLRYFLAIAEQGSFSRAARILNVAQPALSLHVRNMEAELGTALLFRSSRGVTPTEAGSILLRHARIILDQMTAAEEEIRGYQNDPAGDVRIGIPGTICQILAVPLITAVHQRYPGIRLRVAEAMSGFILEWMREERVDLAVLYGPANDHGIRTEYLLEEYLQFFGPAGGLRPELLPPPGTGLDLARISALPLILPGQGHGLRSLLDKVAEQEGQRFKTTIDVDSYRNIKALVAEGLGYSILPENSISAEVADGRLRSWPITRPAVSRSIHLAHSASRPMTNAARAVLALVREILHDLARTGQWVGTSVVDQD